MQINKVVEGFRVNYQDGLLLGKERRIGVELFILCPSELLEFFTIAVYYFNNWIFLSQLKY